MRRSDEENLTNGIFKKDFSPGKSFGGRRTDLSIDQQAYHLSWRERKKG